MTSSDLSTIDLISRLVSFDTTSRNSNLPLIRWVEAWLAARGVESRVTLDASGEKANLHAVVGPRVPGGIAPRGDQVVDDLDLVRVGFAEPGDDRPERSRPAGRCRQQHDGGWCSHPRGPLATRCRGRPCWRIRPVAARR